MDDAGGSRDYNELVEFLALGAFAAIPLRILFGMDPAQLGASHVAIIALCIAGMILFPGRNRLRTLTVNKDGVNATLDEEKKAALASVAQAVGADVADQIRPQVAQAQSKEAVDGIRRAALEVGKLKINAAKKLAAVVSAIQDRKKLRISYAPTDGPATERVVVPLDLQPGRTGATAGRDYLWVASDDGTTPQRFLFSNVLDAQVTDQPFDPATLTLPDAKVPRLIHRDW